MSSSEPISSLKGIGEKTGKLFEKLGVITIDDLLSYYPRAYDTYETAVPVGQLKDQMVMSVAAALPQPPDLLRTGKIQMVSAYVQSYPGHKPIPSGSFLYAEGPAALEGRLPHS